MNNKYQRTFESLRRVPDFLDTNAAVLGPITTAPARKEVDAAVAAVVSHLVRQGSAIQTQAGQMNRRVVLGKELIASHMRPITNFARGNLRGVPGYADLTVRANLESPTRLLTRARTMADVAAKYTDRFVSAGMSPETVERLRAATDAYADALDQHSHARGLRIVSTSQIGNVLMQGRDAVKVLDALITQLLPVNDPLLSAWRSISRVEDKKGKVRRTGTAPTVAQPAPQAVPPVVNEGPAKAA